MSKEVSKEVFEKVVEELRLYRTLIVRDENERERREAGVHNLFPVLQEGEPYQLKMRQIQRTIERTLDPVQQQIIQKKYVSAGDLKDIVVYEDIGITKLAYYHKRNAAIREIAIALGIIGVPYAR